MTFRGRLHLYQEETVDRIISRQKLLVAFGCGTGKTVMAIAAAERLLSCDPIPGHPDVHQVLILCPASLKYQWADKIKEFTDSSFIVIDGSKDMRSGQYLHCFAREYPKYIIASYDAVIHDYFEISGLKHEFTICDEVTAIKSLKTQRSKRVKKLFKTPYRLGLTATPIENKPEELYSIMQWVDDTVLGRYDLFNKAYIRRHPKGWVIAYKNLDVLKKRMGEAMARKTRHDPDVMPYLPDVDEDNWTVQMDDKTFKVYKYIAKDMLSYIEDNPYMFGDKVDLRFGYEFDESTADGKLMAMYMCLEMLLNHPKLLEWSAIQYEKDNQYGSAYANHVWRSGVLENLDSSSKLILLMDRVDDLMLEEDSKIIIVSRYKHMLHLIGMALEMRDNFSFVTFTGDMSAKEKAFKVRRFTEDPECRIFLASYAGGYGLDLYMADYLINYDLPWSFGTKDQINSRHIRASSGFSKVYIRNMITEGSVEERKLRIVNRKQQISDAVIDGADIPDNLVSVDGDFLRSHLEEVLTGTAPSGRLVSRE